MFKDVGAPPCLSINRGFSAPIKLVTDLSRDDLAFLAAHDSDPFNRWQAIQSIAMALLIENVAALRGNKTPRSDERLIAAVGGLLDNRSLEPAFVALALVPPAEADIAREISQNIDPDAVFRARLHLRTAIGDMLKERLGRTYDGMATHGPYSPDATSAGRRSLRNICLDLLAAGGAADALARAEQQYQAADNMTDRLSALATLTQHDTPARERALADFYRRYADNALVIDKWFTLQAAIPEAATLERVRGLTRHSAFDFSNPNRLRALIGAFAQANPSQFNRPDGTGYEFLADTILALDPKNPQVAARLATAFRSWRTMEAGRRDRAQAALSRIKTWAKLSRDLAEILERTLGDGANSNPVRNT